MLAEDDECTTGDSGRGCAVNAMQFRALKTATPPPEAAAPEGEEARCNSKLMLGPVTMASRKGIVLDDTTFQGCADEIPAFFPNTNASLKSLRLAKAWDPEWSPHGRHPAWKKLVSYVKENGVQVLMGTEVTCSETLDKQSWDWAKELLKMLGPEHVMGLSIGSEVELLYTLGERRKEAPVTPECIRKLWNGDDYYWKTGRFWRHFQLVAREFDSIGFASKPLTSVLGVTTFAGVPFVDTTNAGVNTFLQQVVSTYGERFVFTFSMFPYFDANMHLDAGKTTCNSALALATNWGRQGLTPSLLRAARARVAQLAPGSRVWLGETGWSSPFAPSLESRMERCDEWSAKSALRAFYDGFLQWDMPEIDHVFYFTLRDSQIFGVADYFGLISACDHVTCKL